MEPISRYSALEIGKQSTTSIENSLQRLDEASQLLCSQEMMQAATVLLGCYPDLGKVDPEVYARMVHGLFMEYPEADVMEVAKYLPRELKWLPTIAEITEALDKLEYDRQCAVAREIAQRRQDEATKARGEPRRFIDHWVPRVMEFAEGDPNTPKVQTRNWVLIPRPK